jgi:hypothetical protein
MHLGTNMSVTVSVQRVPGNLEPACSLFCVLTISFRGVCSLWHAVVAGFAVSGTLCSANGRSLYRKVIRIGCVKF